MNTAMTSARQWAGSRLAGASGLSAPLLVVAILALMVRRSRGSAPAMLGMPYSRE